MSVLGISAFYHDAAAAVVSGGEIVGAAQEERFTRIKNDSRFPKHAIQYCLSLLPRGAKSVDAIAFYEDPLDKRARAVQNFLTFGAKATESLKQSLSSWGQYDALLTDLADVLGESEDAVKKKLSFIKHHYSHAASTYFCSGFADAAILTVDGVGEHATTTLGEGRGGHLRLIENIEFPQSLGLYYSVFTHYLGFKVNSGEYKLMGLAPLGEPTKKDLILQKVLRLRDDGSFELDLSLFTYHLQNFMYDRDKLERVLGVPPRSEKDPMTEAHRDLAASVQAALEDALYGLVRRARAQVNSKNLCVAGGVALNCSAFGKIRQNGPFENIFAQPAAGDAGGAMGAALALNEKLNGARDTRFSVYLGPGIETDPARAYFKERGYPFEEIADDDALVSRVVDALEAGKIVGWCRGRMEWGARALGSRSILASPLVPDIKRELNLRIKKREGFRPFAPVITEEHMGALFSPAVPSPTMSFVSFLKEELRGENAALDCDGKHLSAEQLRTVKNAVIHRDHSARIQTVNREKNGLYYQVVRSYFDRTGCPLLVNTSMNVRGEPIVCTFDDAYRCFIRAEIDVLVVGQLILYRDKQPTLPQSELEAFEPD